MLISTIIYQERPNRLPEKEGSQCFELLLAECVPNVQLRPLTGIFYFADFTLDLNCLRGLLVVIEHVVNESIDNRCLAHTFMSNEYKFIVKVRTVTIKDLLIVIVLVIVLVLSKILHYYFIMFLFL